MTHARISSSVVFMVGTTHPKNELCCCSTKELRYASLRSRVEYAIRLLLRLSSKYSQPVICQGGGEREREEEEKCSPSEGKTLAKLKVEDQRGGLGFS